MHGFNVGYDSTLRLIARRGSSTVWRNRTAAGWSFNGVAVRTSWPRRGRAGGAARSGQWQPYRVRQKASCRAGV